jgi:hypothetical protein
MIDGDHTTEVSHHEVRGAVTIEVARLDVAGMVERGQDAGRLRPAWRQGDYRSAPHIGDDKLRWRFGIELQPVQVRDGWAHVSRFFRAEMFHLKRRGQSV